MKVNRFVFALPFFKTKDERNMKIYFYPKNPVKRPNAFARTTILNIS